MASAVVPEVSAGPVLVRAVVEALPAWGAAVAVVSAGAVAVVEVAALVEVVVVVAAAVVVVVAAVAEGGNSYEME